MAEVSYDANRVDKGDAQPQPPGPIGDAGNVRYTFRKTWDHAFTNAMDASFLVPATNNRDAFLDEGWQFVETGLIKQSMNTNEWQNMIENSDKWRCVTFGARLYNIRALNVQKQLNSDAEVKETTALAQNYDVFEGDVRWRDMLVQADPNASVFDVNNKWTHQYMTAYEDGALPRYEMKLNRYLEAKRHNIPEIAAQATDSQEYLLRNHKGFHQKKVSEETSVSFTPTVQWYQSNTYNLSGDVPTAAGIWTVTNETKPFQVMYANSFTATNQQMGFRQPCLLIKGCRAPGPTGGITVHYLCQAEYWMEMEWTPRMRMANSFQVPRWLQVKQPEQPADGDPADPWLFMQGRGPSLNNKYHFNTTPIESLAAPEGAPLARYQALYTMEDEDAGALVSQRSKPTGRSITTTESRKKDRSERVSRVRESIAQRQRTSTTPTTSISSTERQRTRSRSTHSSRTAAPQSRAHTK